MRRRRERALGRIEPIETSSETSKVALSSLSPLSHRYNTHNDEGAYPSLSPAYTTPYLYASVPPAKAWTRDGARCDSEANYLWWTPGPGQDLLERLPCRRSRYQGCYGTSLSLRGSRLATTEDREIPWNSPIDNRHGIPEGTRSTTGAIRVDQAGVRAYPRGEHSIRFAVDLVG